MESTDSLAPLVLVIDDDSSVHLWAERFLIPAGFMVVNASSGKEGIACFQHTHPDLVLVDIRMPGMDGFETCQKIRALPRGKESAILMMTGAEDTKTVEHSFRSGATDFVVKPVNWEILIHRLRYMIKANREHQELQRSEQRYQALIDNTPFCVYEIDESRHIQSMNKTGLTCLKKTESEVLKKPYLDFIIPDRRKDLEQFLSRTFDGEELPSFEHTRVNSGEILWFQTIYKLIPDNQNKTILGISQNITENKHAEIALQKNKQMLEAILNNTSAVVYMKDLEGKFLYINHQFEVLFNVSNADLIGETDYAIFPDDIVKQLRANDLEVIEHGKNIEFEETVKYKEKIQTYISVKFPLYDHIGNIYATCGISTDISKRKLAEQALTTSETKFHTLFDSTNDAVIVADEERFIDCNRATLKLFGCSILEDFCSKTVADISPPEQPCGTSSMTLAKQQIALAKEKGSNHFEWMHKRLDTGEIFPADVLLSKLTINSETLIQASVRDITKRKKAEDALRLSARVFSETNEGITITDAKGNIIDVNIAFCDITGYSREDAIGKNPNFLNSGRQSAEFYEDMWRTIDRQGHWQGEIWNRKKEGEIYAELLTISAILDEDGNVLNYVGLFSDITRSKQQQETLVRMAHYDVLTQLPNRVLLADRFTRAMAHSKRNKTMLAICFLDLDNFKPVNDNYGHEAGDQLLIEVAERISANIRDEDTVSRLGGDEFGLLLGDIESFSQCEHMLKRILESLAQPYFIDENLLSISATIGVSLYPTDNADLDTLMRHADQAMYQAKLAGRNRYSLFNAEQDKRTIQKNIQLQEIEHALSNDEFCLYYQPKINMATGKVFGAEALIRWLHPENGLMLPLKFLPTIEETELEILMGNWVINEALKQLNEWKDQGLEFEVSVNISSYHLQSPSFVTDLEAALATYPTVDTAYFQLEILESSALGDLQSISGIIKTCIEALGVNIALDDFGTGYSSLTHLRNLPANTIKIDQSFVRDVLDDPNDYAIIEGVLGLANAFNRKVIAEGVETTEHGLMLLLMGCNKAQGYGISRPIPADEIPNWLNNYIPAQEWIAFSNKALTSKDNTIGIYRLALNQWLKLLENNIKSPADSTKHWPITDQKRCFCHYWLKRARQEQLFEEHWLEKLDEIHLSIHRIADDLLNKYLQGKIDEARNGLKEIQIVFEKMNSILSNINKNCSA